MSDKPEPICKDCLHRVTCCRAEKRRQWYIQHGLEPPQKRTWRERAALCINEVLRETYGLPRAEIDALLGRAYPFGEREGYPYKVWLEELRRIRGQRVKPPTRLKRERLAAAAAGDVGLFGEER